ncbi:hypothetical protein MA9V2_140 [Chryseobacterium phage MA9V-2]|nr:hypothetical protein MA9V2_140 [Chryseobacterium phage MA9V-2]
MQKFKFSDLLSMFSNALFIMRLVFTTLAFYIAFRLTLTYLNFETLATLWPAFSKIDPELLSTMTMLGRMALLCYIGYTYIINACNAIHDRLTAGEYINTEVDKTV